MTKTESEGISKENFEKIQSQRAKSHKRRALGLAAATALFLGKGVLNLYDAHVFDKYVSREIRMAGTTITAGNDNAVGENILTMESSLQSALENLHEGKASALENPAIIWKTPYTSTTELCNLLELAIGRTREFEQLRKAFETGKSKDTDALWVKNLVTRLDVDAKLESTINSLPEPDREAARKLSFAMLDSYHWILGSEIGGVISAQYDAMNSTVAGGTRTKAKKIDERNNSLLDKLEDASGWRAIIRFEADDFKEAYAETRIGLLRANLGHLDLSLENFRKAKAILDKYPADKNIAIWRDTPDLAVGNFQGGMNSTILEISRLKDDHSTYSAGWWTRLLKFNESIGGDLKPSLSDMADAINERYLARAGMWGFFALLTTLGAAFYSKKYRMTKKYHVPIEKLK